jgi:hypothetical protein
MGILELGSDSNFILMNASRYRIGAERLFTAEDAEDAKDYFTEHPDPECERKRPETPHRADRSDD